MMKPSFLVDTGSLVVATDVISEAMEEPGWCKQGSGSQLEKSPGRNGGELM